MTFEGGAIRTNANIQPRNTFLLLLVTALFVAMPVTFAAVPVNDLLEDALSFVARMPVGSVFHVIPFETLGMGGKASGDCNNRFLHDWIIHNGDTGFGKLI